MKCSMQLSLPDNMPASAPSRCAMASHGRASPNAMLAFIMQVIFEEFQFASYLPLSGPELTLRSFAAQHPETLAHQAMCGVVVDSGFSFTHVAPIFDSRILSEGVRRINLGGKALTNYLKELVSFRLVAGIDLCLVKRAPSPKNRSGVPILAYKLLSSWCAGAST